MTAGDIQVFKPSVRAYVQNTGAAIIIGLPLLTALYLTSGDKPLMRLAIAIAALGSIGGVLLYIARARVYVTPDSLGKRGFGFTKWTPRAAVHRGLLVRSLSAGKSSPAAAHLFLFAPDSALEMRLYGAIWGLPQLQAVADALGIEPVVYSSIDIAALRDLEPTALNWGESNPKALAAIVLGAFAVVAVVVAVILYSTR